jgi:hypothetical protein
MSPTPSVPLSRQVSSDAGFSLAEVAVAAGIFASALVAVADLVARSVVVGVAARRTTYAALLAQQKVEELRALTYGYDPSGVPATDTASDTAQAPTSVGGGTGLTSSMASSLDRDEAGFVDYVRADGVRAASRDAGAVFSRRWSIVRPAGWADDGLVIQVYVTDRPGRTAARPPGHRLDGEARIFAVRPRLAP